MNQIQSASSVTTYPAATGGSKYRTASANHSVDPPERRPADGIDWDPNFPGLGLRTRCGRQTWIIQYRKKGCSIRRTIGTSPSMTRDSARVVARERLAPRVIASPASEFQEDTATRFEDFLPIFLKHSRNRWKLRTQAKAENLRV